MSRETTETPLAVTASADDSRAPDASPAGGEDGTGRHFEAAPDDRAEEAPAGGS